MRRIHVPIIALLWLMIASPLLAQTGGLTVIVSDEKGPLVGATVELSSDRGRLKSSVLITDAQGQVRFPVLMPGDGYIVEISFPGFSTIRDSTVKIAIGKTTILPIQMTETFTETTTVTARSDIVDLEQPQTTTRFDDSFVQELPVRGRFYENVLTLAPGIQDSNDDGNPTVHGSRARDFKALVGGIANVDPFTGQKLANVNPNAIEAIEVITAGAGPEYGRAQGGYANLILKQGSNRFEGVAEFIYSGSEFDKMGAVKVPTSLAPDYSWEQPSVQVSGPIVKDKLWFRLSHERIARQDPLLIAGPNAVTTSDQRIISDQITWQVSPRNKLAFRFDSNPLDQQNFGLSSLNFIEATENRGFKSEAYSVTWDAPFSPNLYVKSIAAFQDSGLIIEPSTKGVPNRCLNGATFITLAQCFDVFSGQTSGSYWLNHDDKRERFTVRSDATFYPKSKWLGMNHTLRFGMTIENERYEQFETRGTDILTELSPRDPFRKTLLVTANISVPPSDFTEAKSTNWAIYFRDSMKPMTNLSIDWGLRVGRESIDSSGLTDFDPREELALYEDRIAQGMLIRDARNQTFTGYGNIVDLQVNLAKLLGVTPGQALSFFGPLPVQNTFLQNFQRKENIELRNTNISPYFAVSWDPWKDGKTKISASAGRHYNNIPLNVPAVELQSPRISLGLLAFKVPTGEFFLPDISSATGSLNPAASIKTVDDNLRTPYQDEFALTFERELWNESSIRLLYVKRDYEDQLQDQDINRTPGDFGTCVRPEAPGFPSIIPIKDGIVDDCVGQLFFFPEFEGEQYQGPDGIPDIYALNPFWGPILKVGNFNSSSYEGIVAEFIRRQFRSWEMQASYTWSIARGDGEDFQQEFGNEPFSVDQEFGFQSTDQRHVVKVVATTITKFGFRMGGSAIWQSGLPFSLLTRRSTFDALPPSLGRFGNTEPRVITFYPTGRRNDQRNPSYWTFNLKFTKDFRMKKINSQFSVEIFDLLNEGYKSVYQPTLEMGRQINGLNETNFRFGRRFQLAAKVSF